MVSTVAGKTLKPYWPTLLLIQSITLINTNTEEVRPQTSATLEM